MGPLGKMYNQSVPKNSLGKTLLLKHFGGTKAYFSYVIPQVKDSYGGERKHGLSFGGIAPMPLQVRSW